jgi:hypothetical protein
VKGSKPGGTVVVGGGGTVVVSVGAWFIYRNVPRILRTEFPNYRVSIVNWACWAISLP